MRWSEVDFELKQWKLPAARMKSSRDHIVPLSSQALAILEHLRDYSDGSDLVFASERNPNKPISDGTVGKALRSIGFGSDVITPHGFRHTASTFLNERTFTVNDESRKFEPDVIERQLAHVQSGVRGIYNKAEYIEDRTLMMQAWADWLDELKG